MVCTASTTWSASWVSALSRRPRRHRPRVELWRSPTPDSSRRSHLRDRAAQRISTRDVVHGEVGAHLTWHWPVIGSVHADTILTTWLVMLVSLAFFWWLGPLVHDAPRQQDARRRSRASSTSWPTWRSARSARAANGSSRSSSGSSSSSASSTSSASSPSRRSGCRSAVRRRPTSTPPPRSRCGVLRDPVLAIRKSGIGRTRTSSSRSSFLFPLNLIEELARPVVLALRLVLQHLRRRAAAVRRRDDHHVEHHRSAR